MLDFDLAAAGRRAALWASPELASALIGPYDVLIAATALKHNHRPATLEKAEIRRRHSRQIADIFASLDS